MMGSSTDGGSSGGSGRSAGLTKKPATIKAKAKTKPGEEGRYTLPSGGTIKTTEMDSDKLTAKRQERAAAVSELLPKGGTRGETEYERQASIAELTGRLDKQPFGIFGAIGRFSLERQLEALKAGATPVKIETPSGELLTVGTITKDGVYTGRSEYGDIAMEAFRAGIKGPFVETSFKAAQERQAALRDEEDDDDTKPDIDEKEQLEQIDDTETGAAMLGEREKRGRRRSKRAGSAGTLLEGGGVLYE
jgi:hypothetical protein